MKPDWKDAPEWAQWVAMDADGDWWWYENKPEFDGESDRWVLPENDFGRSIQCEKKESEDSLERRP